MRWKTVGLLVVVHMWLSPLVFLLGMIHASIGFRDNTGFQDSFFSWPVRVCVKWWCFLSAHFERIWYELDWPRESVGTNLLLSIAFSVAVVAVAYSLWHWTRGFGASSHGRCTGSQ